MCLIEFDQVRLNYACPYTSLWKLIFADHLVLKYSLANKTLSSILIPKILTSAAKNLKISSQIKILPPKIILTRAFFHFKNVTKGGHYFPRFLFYFIVLKALNQHQILNMRNRSKRINKVTKFVRILTYFGLPPLHMQNTLSGLFLALNFYFMNRFSKYLQHFLGLLECKRMTRSFLQFFCHDMKNC